MTGHGKKVCEHGTVISQCRCPHHGNTQVVKPCPFPEHAEPEAADELDQEMMPVPEPDKHLTLRAFREATKDLPEDTYVSIELWHFRGLYEIKEPERTNFGQTARRIVEKGRNGMVDAVRVEASKRQRPGTPTEHDEKYGTTPPDIEVTYPQIVLS